MDLSISFKVQACHEKEVCGYLYVCTYAPNNLSSLVSNLKLEVWWIGFDPQHSHHYPSNL